MITLRFLDEIKYSLLFALTLLCGVNFWFALNPVLSPSVYSFASTAETDIFETTVLATQLDRAKSLRNVDTIIIGDSSALMGIDASQLSRGLNRNVQNLSTMGYVGPAGYRSLLEQYFANNKTLNTLIIQINPIILSDDETNFSNRPYENQAISKSMYYKLHFPGSGMEWVRRNAMGAALPTPLPGNYGKKYLFRRFLINHLRQHGGSMFDPAPALKDVPVGSRPIKIAISDPVRRRLIILRQFLDENSHRIGKKLLILSPTNLRSASSIESQMRIRAAKEVSSILGIDLKNVINPIEHLPDHLYVGFAHLTRQGQNIFTTLLERKLAFPQEVNEIPAGIDIGAAVNVGPTIIDFSKENPLIEPYAQLKFPTKLPINLFSNEGRDDFDLTGLSGLESNGKENWRWATGPATRIQFYVDPDSPEQARQLLLKLSFKNGVPIPHQTVTIRLNGKIIRHFSAEEIGVQKLVDADGTLIANKGDNILEFVYEDWNRGKKVYGNDPRQLSVVIMRMSLQMDK